MRNSTIAAFAFAAILAGGAVARADDFGQRQAPSSSTAYSEYGSRNQDSQSFSAYLDHQATNSELSDPTAPNSIRSHGNH